MCTAREKQCLLFFIVWIDIPSKWDITLELNENTFLCNNILRFMKINNSICVDERCLLLTIGDINKNQTKNENHNMIRFTAETP